MKRRTINLAQEFSDTPGGRFRDQGECSGEEFRDDVLLPALRDNDEVTINLDGVLGLPASFLDESFGAIARKYKAECQRMKIQVTDNATARRILEDCVPRSSLCWE